MPASPNRKTRQLISIAQAADVAGCGSRTIRRRISDGTLRGYRVGPTLLRVDLREVEDILVRQIPTTDGQSRNGAGQ